MRLLWIAVAAFLEVFVALFYGGDGFWLEFFKEGQKPLLYAGRDPFKIRPIRVSGHQVMTDSDLMAADPDLMLADI